jgi:hypothetical protein
VAILVTGSRRSSTTVENVQSTPTGRSASRSGGTGARPRPGPGAQATRDTKPGPKAEALLPA